MSDEKQRFLERLRGLGITARPVPDEKLPELYELAKEEGRSAGWVCDVLEMLPQEIDDRPEG